MKWILVLVILIPTSVAQANQEYGCVRYQRADLSWGDWYRIPVIITDGNELNKALETTNFRSWDKYAVGTWPNGGYSLFKIPSYMQSLNITATRTEDQRGTTHQIKQAPSVGRCF